MHFNKTRSITKLIFDSLTRVLPSLFWILLIFAFDTPLIAIATILCAVIHEAGHIAALVLLNKRNKLSASLSGLRLSDYGSLSYKEELFVALAGPLINIIVFLLCILLNTVWQGYIGIFAILNLLTAMSNLLPINGYDGSKALGCILSYRFGEENSYRITASLSFALCVILSLLSLYLMSRLDTGYFIFFVFFVILVKNLKV